MKYLITLLFATLFFAANSQSLFIKGVIKDATTGETLIGASATIKAGTGAVSDLDGNFSIKVEPGTYNLKAFYVGYEPMSQKVVVKDKDVFVTIILESVQLDEVEITANIGTVRETPVAISNISQQKIAEELGGRDITMVMNSTPGVYATEQGGGSGDSRVTLRGFDQTNIAVMVDGVPVNDMENGAVFWSNWDGLSEITKTMQIQRGLGATKLAVSSVGGTMNIITNGIEQKQQTTIKRDFGNNNYQRTSLSYNSGLIKNKYGIVFAGSYKKGDGWAQGTWTEAWSYFFKFQWKVNSRNLISISANGAPQKHGQRNNKLTIGAYSQNFAHSLGIVDPQANMLASGITTKAVGSRPFQYNSTVGLLNGDEYNIAQNFYHKPLFNLSHFWNVSDKLSISTVYYASFGNGGGSGALNTVSADPTTGFVKLNPIFLANSTSSLTSASNANYSKTEHRSTNIIRASMNNHQWYGILSTASYQLDSAFKLTFGVDARYYRGLHFRKVYDLMGGDYFVNSSNTNQVKGYYLKDPLYKHAMKREDDKILYNYDGLVDWGGLFSQLEYKKNKWTAFATATGSYTGYQRKDYYAKKDVIIGDKDKGFKRMVDFFKDNRSEDILESVIGYGDTLLYVNKDNYQVYNNSNFVFNSGDTTFIVKYNSAGTTPIDTTYIVGAKSYNIESKEAQFARTRKKWFPGFTLKGGANYKINTHFNVYANVGVLSVAPKFNNVFNTNTVGNLEYNDADNQFIISQEVGAGAKYKKFAVNVNIYYTIWKNRPVNPQTGLDGEVYNVNGMDASHKGIEFDWSAKLLKNLEWEGALSLADWIYTSNRTVYVFDDLGVLQFQKEFSAKGVHIGNTAQHQISNAFKYYVIKGLFIKPRYTFFGKNYSNFDLLSLEKANANRDSWMIPDYGVLDMSLGYEMKYEGLKINLILSLNNALNTVYISDAQNNAFTNQNYDANSASVFFGQGRRYVIGVKATF